MSLRLRLTLIYTGLLSIVVILLSGIIYAMFSWVMVNHIDDYLQRAADQIIGVLGTGSMDDLTIPPDSLNLSDLVYYQIWDDDGRLSRYSENASKFADAMDGDALLENRSIYREVTMGEDSYRVLTVPLPLRGGETVWLQVGEQMTEARYSFRLLRNVFGISALFAILLAGVTVWLVTRKVTEPLEKMVEVTRQINSVDDLSKRLPVSAERNDEISELGLSFNQTLERLEGLFAAQNRFLADVSHELRTPLTVIKGNVGLMRMMKTFDAQSLNSIEFEVDRLTRLVETLLLIEQAESGKLPLTLSPLQMDELLFEVYEQMQVLSEGAYQIQVGHVDPITIMGDRDRLKQVLLNLGNNAIKYSQEGGQILLSLFVKGDWVQIVLRDHGKGIPEDQLDKIFDRFYREDRSRTRYDKKEGFGLGLSITYWIVRHHGGRIEVETKPDQGTAFSVWLPLSQAEIPDKPTGLDIEQEKRHQ
jgi:two-component system, OmpR family, sensor kinase